MYGQYSDQSSRSLTMTEYRRYHAAPNATRPKTCTGHNRVVYTAPDRTRRFMLHTTDVVTLNNDGTVTLDDGGWPTLTTRRAMTEGIFELTGLNLGVGSCRGKQSVGYGDIRLQFDGRITFDPRRFAA